jgi:hypothetical protein
LLVNGCRTNGLWREDLGRCQRTIANGFFQIEKLMTPNGANEREVT